MNHLTGYYNSINKIEKLEKELKEEKKKRENSVYTLWGDVDDLIKWNEKDEEKRLSSNIITDDEKIAIEIICDYGTHKTLCSEKLFKIVELVGIKDFEIKPINSERFYIVFYFKNG